MNQIVEWFSANFVEILAAVLGIAYIFFSIRQSIFTWPVGLLTSVLYVWVFFVSKLYADMSLQMYYVFISIYGWVVWSGGGKSTHSEPLKISRITSKWLGILLVISVLLFVFIWFILSRFTDSPVPMADGLSTALSIVATWMLARKLMENWLLWIFVDGFSIGLFIYKGLYPTVVLFVVYTIMAYLGFREWKRDFEKHLEPNCQ
jgi:nicotinamide mononucleotide transporter